MFFIDRSYHVVPDIARVILLIPVPWKRGGNLWIARNLRNFGKIWTKPKKKWRSYWGYPSRPYTAMSRVGEPCRLMLKDRCFFWLPEKEATTTNKNLAGELKNVLPNRKKNVLHGSFKQASFAGSSTEPFAVEQPKKNGKKKWRYAVPAKFWRRSRKLSRVKGCRKLQIVM